MKGTGCDGHYFVADLSKRENAEWLARQALLRMGRVDILVSNAGTTVISEVDQIKDTDWDYVMETNLGAAMVLTRAHRDAGAASFIFPEYLAWGKRGKRRVLCQEGWTYWDDESQALGRFGTTVNCLAPGPFLTDLPASVLSSK